MDKLSFQNEIVERLNISSANNKLVHSYIFSGRKESGQLEVAKHFAKIVIADNNSNFESLIDNFTHPNLFYISSEKQNISKEQVVEMTSEMNSTSLTGASKVFIVEDSNKLSVSAQNSLLKVIEEPQGNSYVIFLVENIYQMLPTIVSRSQIVKFKPLPFETIVEEISSQYDDKVRLKYALYLDDVNYDDLYNSDGFENYQNVVKNCFKIYFSNDDLQYLLEEHCYKFFNKKEEVKNLVNLLIINSSTIISYQENISSKVFDKAVLEIVSTHNSDILLEFLTRLFECYEMLDANVNVRLAFDKVFRKDVM